MSHVAEPLEFAICLELTEEEIHEQVTIVRGGAEELQQGHPPLKAVYLPHCHRTGRHRESLISWRPKGASCLDTAPSGPPRHDIWIDRGLPRKRGPSAPFP